MKAVLISIQPKWCELIASGKKTVEVRKTRPKIETPFKVYIYQTIDGGAKYDRIVSSGLICGKVIGEFVCDKIVKFENSWYDPAFGETSDLSCVGWDELAKYLGGNEYGYGWHISDLVIYDKPRDLSEFRTPDWYRDCEKQCDNMERMRCPVKDSRKADKMSGWCRKAGKQITRPFQSWGYVESEDAK